MRPRTHGLSKSREYRAWLSAKTRCYNSRYHNYRHYGGRGIRMAGAWINDFSRFLADMGQCPDGCSLDRFPDPNGDYAPGNCRWATEVEQHRNRRDNLLLTFQGLTLTAAEWAIRLNMRTTTLTERISRGWSTDRALTDPVRPHRRAS